MLNLLQSAGTLTSLLSVAANSVCSNIFSVTQRIINLKLIIAYRYLVSCSIYLLNTPLL